MIPGLQPDADSILTNVEILNLTTVPKSLAIIGAGAVGVEFGSMFKKFGSDVTIFEMLPRLVPVEDEEISKELERSFKKQKIRIETGMELIDTYSKAGDLDKAAATVSVLRELDPTNVEIIYASYRIYSDLVDESRLSLTVVAPNSARVHQTFHPRPRRKQISKPSVWA